MAQLVDPSLVTLSYAAALDEGLWESWLSALVSKFGGVGGSLSVPSHKSEADRVRGVYLTRQDSALIMAEYAEQRWHDPQSSLMLDPDFTGIYTDADLRPYATTKLEREYLAWESGRCNVHHYLTLQLKPAPGIKLVLCVHRSRTAGPIKSAQKTQLALLAPHLNHAIQFWHLHSQAVQESWWQGAAASSQRAVALLDESGICIRLTPALEQLVSRGDYVTLRNARFGALDPTDHDKLSALIDRAVGPFEPKAGSMPLTGNDRGKSSLLSVFPSPKLRRFPVPAGAAAMLVIELKEQTGRNFDEYGLTRREFELAKLLRDGHSLESASYVMAISKNTARVFLAAIFAKTSTNRQVDLLRKLM